MTAGDLAKPAALAAGQVWEIEWTMGKRSRITLRAPVGAKGNAWSSDEHPGGITGEGILLRDENCIRARYLGTRGQAATPRQAEAVLGAIKVWRDDYRREGEMACVEVSPMPPAVILHEPQGLPIETPPAHLALLTERAAPPERDRTAAEFFAGKGERYSPATGWTR